MSFAGKRTSSSISPIWKLKSAALPASVEARRWTTPETKMSVVGVVDPQLAHAWPRWNAIGAMCDFFETVPTR